MSAEAESGNHQRSDVNRLIHEPVRYDIMALLSVLTSAEFLFVQNQLRLTPGNLSAHVTKLESAGYIWVQKRFVGRKPRTFLSLSNEGRRAFEDYRNRMRERFNSPPAVRGNDVNKP